MYMVRESACKSERESAIQIVYVQIAAIPRRYIQIAAISRRSESRDIAESEALIRVSLAVCIASRCIYIATRCNADPTLTFRVSRAKEPTETSKFQNRPFWNQEIFSKQAFLKSRKISKQAFFNSQFGFLGLSGKSDNGEEEISRGTHTYICICIYWDSYTYVYMCIWIHKYIYIYMCILIYRENWSHGRPWQDWV